jgi:hypothetical protein
MPQIDVTISAGRTPEQIRAMIHEVHEAVVRTVDARPEHVRGRRPGGSPCALGDRRRHPDRDGCGARGLDADREGRFG